MIGCARLVAPAQEAVEYEQKTITHNLDDPNSKYRGDPSSEVDAAWDELLRCKFTRDTTCLKRPQN